MQFKPLITPRRETNIIITFLYILINKNMTYVILDNKIVEIKIIEQKRVVSSKRIQEKIDNLQANIDRLNIEKSLIEMEETKLEPELELEPEEEIISEK